MRRVIVIGVSVAALAVAGALAARELLNSAEKSRDIARLLERARTLNANEVTRSDAIVALDEILKIDPDNLDAHRELANAYNNLQTPRFDKVIEHLQRADALTKNDPDIKLQLAKAHLARYLGSSTDEDFKAARAGFLDLMSSPATEADAMYSYAMLYVANGKYRDLNKALEKLEQLLAKHPEFEDKESAANLADHLRKVLNPKESAKDGG